MTDRDEHVDSDEPLVSYDESGEPIVHSGKGGTIRIVSDKPAVLSLNGPNTAGTGHIEVSRPGRGHWRVDIEPVMITPLAPFAPFVPISLAPVRRSARAPRPQRRPGGVHNRSPDRSTDAGDGDDDPPLAVLLGALELLCGAALDRGDWPSAVDAAAAAWSEAFAYSWTRLDPERDHVCPRCLGELVFSPAALTWRCEACYHRLLAVFARRTR